MESPIVPLNLLTKHWLLRYIFKKNEYRISPSSMFNTLIFIWFLLFFNNYNHNENVTYKISMLDPKLSFCTYICVCVYVYILRCCYVQPDSVEAQGDRQAASHLVKRRKQLHTTGLSANENRFLVGNQGWILISGKTRCKLCWLFPLGKVFCKPVSP